MRSLAYSPEDVRLLRRLRNLAPGDPDFPGPRAHARLSALCALAEGHDEATAARILKRTRQAVNHQARRFLRTQALRRTGRQPNRYEPGREFAVAVAARGRDHGGWSVRRGEAPVARVHNVQAFLRVRHRATSLPLPQLRTEWWAGKGRTRHSLFGTDLGRGRVAKWTFIEGPRRAAVVVHLPDAFAGPDALAAAPRRFREELAHLVSILEGRHGFTFSACGWKGRPEIALPAPGMEGLVGAGSEVVWWDKSCGIPEVEGALFGVMLAEARRREALLQGMESLGTPLTDSMLLRGSRRLSEVLYAR